MKLKAMERLMLLGILPEKGDFATLKIVGKLRGDLSFTEKEHKNLSIKQTGKQITWDTLLDKGVDIDIGNVARAIIVAALTELDKKKELTPQQVSIYEKFMG